MKWIFYGIGAIGLVAGIAILSSPGFIFQQIAGILIALFGLIALGFGALIGRRKA